MEVIAYAALVMVLLKAAWNVTVPVALKKKSEGQGVSLMPLVELALLAAAVTASWLSHGSGWINSPAAVAVGGGAVIVASYLLIPLTSVFSWSLRRKPR